MGLCYLVKEGNQISSVQNLNRLSKAYRQALHPQFVKESHFVIELLFTFLIIKQLWFFENVENFILGIAMT